MSSTTVAAYPAPASAIATDWTGRPGAESRTWPSEQMIRLICRNVPAYQRPAMRVLDVGCANGRNAIGLRQLGFGDVMGVDPLGKMVQATLDNARQVGAAVSAQRGEVPGLPVRDESVDLAVAWGVLFILGGPVRTAAALADIRRTLTPEGVLISDWRTDQDDLRGYALRPVAEDTYELAPDAPAQLGGLAYSFWTAEQVRGFHADAGFDVVAMQRYEVADVLGESRHSWWQVCARAV